MLLAIGEELLVASLGTYSWKKGCSNMHALGAPMLPSYAYDTESAITTCFRVINYEQNFKR